jgi:hypothetical protein
MSAQPFTADTVYRWERNGIAHAGQIVAAMPLKTTWRVVLMDTAEAHWVGDISADGEFSIRSGPVTGAEALDAAQRILCGVRDRGSVSGTTHVLAVALVAQIAATEGV